MKNIDRITGELEFIIGEVINYTNFTYVAHDEDDCGGTITLHGDTYHIILDYDITGGYNYHLATTKYDNNGFMELEERNQKYVKTPKAVINYINRFDK